MKPVKTYSGSIEGNLDGHRIEMDLDLSAEGRAHLLSLMTDLYSDQELAIIREYSTNAYDANVMAGNGHIPIRVTTPKAGDNAFTSTNALVIEDDGVGLDVSDLENIYSKYGASNKRGSDDVNGMLGLGGKSALTYTSQFMVTARKAGVETQVVVTRNEDGIGVMEVVSQVKTDKPNGVKITIPAKASGNLREKAEQFFYYWKPGTVLLNGEQPKHMLAEDGHTKIGDDVFIQSMNYYEKSDDIIVMGNVPYTLTGEHADSFSRMVTNSDNRNYRYNDNKRVVVFVEMGAITFAPSREAASFTPRTMATIQRVQEKIKADLEAQIRKDLTNAGSFPEAFTLWAKWTQLVGVKNIPSDITYQGHEFALSVDAKYSTINIGSGRYNSSKGEYGDRISNSEGKTRPVGYQDIYKADTLCIVNYPNDTAPAGGSRAKIKQYIEDELGDGINTVLLFDEMPGSPWTDEVRRVDWDEIKAIKIAYGVRVSGGKSGKIPVTVYESGIPTSVYRDYSRIGNWAEKEIDSTKPIYYVSPSDIKTAYSNRLRSSIHNVKSFFPDAQIVLIGKNRWDKFVKENPTAIELSKYVKDQFSKDMKNGMSDDELFYADHDSDYREVAKMLGDATNDEDITRLAKIAKTIDTAKVEVYNGEHNATKALDRKYPLNIQSYYISKADYKAHVIAYINAIQEGI